MVMTNLLILLVLASCVLLPTTTQASYYYLSERYSKCEKEFWYKDLSHYKQSLKSKCLKEKHHDYYDKRHYYYYKKHRPHNVCHDKPNDKNAILSNWQKFSECRCDSSLDFERSKVLVCYQIASLNKATGSFIGQLSFYKKKSKSFEYYDVAIKFSDNIKLNNNGWNEYEKGYYRSSETANTDDRDGYLVETRLIYGEIPKSESMSRVSMKGISPEFLLIDNDGGSSKPLSDQVTIVPFSSFTPNTQLESALPASKSIVSTPPNNIPSTSNNAASVGPSASDNEAPSGAGGSGPSSSSSGGGSSGKSDGSTGTANTDNTDSSSANSNHVSSSDEHDGNSGDNGKNPPPPPLFTGFVVFTVIISIGAAFVGYNTYERFKYRRQYQNRQANAQQNASLASVPDYNGYGRAH